MALHRKGQTSAEIPGLYCKTLVRKSIWQRPVGFCTLGVNTVNWGISHLLAPGYYGGHSVFLPTLSPKPACCIYYSAEGRRHGDAQWWLFEGMPGKQACLCEGPLWIDEAWRWWTCTCHQTPPPPHRPAFLVPPFHFHASTVTLFSMPTFLSAPRPCLQVTLCFWLWICSVYSWWGD